MAGIGDISSKILTNQDPALMEVGADTDKNHNLRGHHNPSYESLDVRDAICIAGHNHDDIVYVKSRLEKLTTKPEKIEGMLIKNDSDIQDGVFLVPKIALVATHYPGKQLIDDDGDSGQLDAMYDEVHETGADALVIYMGLPAAIYPPLKSGFFHTEMEKRLFPSQPALQDLTENDCLITLTDGCDFNSDQKRLLRHWLSKAVDKYHPVYERAKELRKARQKSAADHTVVPMGTGAVPLQKF